MQGRAVGPRESPQSPPHPRTRCESGGVRFHNTAKKYRDRNLYSIDVIAQICRNHFLPGDENCFKRVVRNFITRREVIAGFLRKTFQIFTNDSERKLTTSEFQLYRPEHLKFLKTQPLRNNFQMFWSLSLKLAKNFNILVGHQHLTCDSHRSIF